MEEEVGVKLFHRGARRITLTNEGILLRRRAELSNWLGDSFQGTKVLFTSNLSISGAIMVQKGLAYSIVIEGSLSFWDKEKISYQPLSPELVANSVLAWKKQQPFGLATKRFIEFIKCFLDINET